MSWRTSPAVLLLRNLGRAVGLTRLLGSLLARQGYEDRFQAAMIGAVCEGDVVWDVGANVGLYSRKFSDSVGPSGKVFAFEPSPANLRRLNDAVASLGNVIVVPMALGAREDTVAFEQGNDPLGATSRVVDAAGQKTEGQVEIQLYTGDKLVSCGMVATPNIIKIDTEGFELDVLLGLRETLQRKGLRLLCIEVRFGLLEERGLRNAPSDIEKLLVSSGFAPSWADASHIVASRIN